MKRFCPSGHDTHICGRGANRRCKVCCNAEAAKWRAENPERMRALGRKHKGVTNCPPEPKDQICMICKKKPQSTLCADHNHTTGLFRGWLCSKHNIGLGMFHDDIKLLKQAIKYLSSNSVNNQLIQ